MEHVLCVYKHIGETPLEVIQRIKKEHPEYANTPMTYAGRLDPMARGLLVLLYGDALQYKPTYLGLNKTYQATIVFGLESDTGDILGIVKNSKQSVVSNTEIENIVPKLIGPIEFELPYFSSYKVQGKPLFWWARQNRIHEIQIPRRITTICNATIQSIKQELGTTLQETAIKNISHVHGDFRQKEILESWRDVRREKIYTTVTIAFECSSGTYIRSIVPILGQYLTTSAILFDLERTKIGDFSISDCM